MPGRDKDLTVVNKDKVRHCVCERVFQECSDEYLSYVLFTLYK